MYFKLSSQTGVQWISKGSEMFAPQYVPHLLQMHSQQECDRRIGSNAERKTHSTSDLGWWTKHSNLGPDDHISERTEGELLLDIIFSEDLCYSTPLLCNIGRLAAWG